MAKQIEESKEAVADNNNALPEKISVENEVKKEEVKTEETKKDTNYANKVEELKVTGKELVTKVKELFREGNIRRIKIKKEGKTVMEVPLSVATVGIIMSPALAAVGALAAVLTECTIEVERAE